MRRQIGRRAIGFGDDILITGIAKLANEKTGRKVAIGDGVRIHWEEVFNGNPRLTREITPGCVWVHAIKGNRPYIDYARTTKERMAWKPWKAIPGELYLTDSERGWSERDFVYMEPNVKGSFGGNKDWGFERWQAVVTALPNIRFIQGPGRKLEGVEQRRTASFRHACGLLSHACLFVGTDGGLAHASAALGKRAVVVWGGLIGPDILGYDTHINLQAKGVKACGSQTPCLHCRQALEWVTVDMVVEKIKEALA